ncbi:hypothetical protein SEVIR_9G572451v4 [Setaria viridis]
MPAAGAPRLHNTCRGVPPVRRDRDPDEDDRRGPRPADDLPRGDHGFADRYRSRSPAHHGRRHDAVGRGFPGRGPHRPPLDYATMGLVEQLGQERPGMVDNLTDQVNSMEIDGPAAEGAEGHGPVCFSLSATKQCFPLTTNQLFQPAYKLKRTGPRCCACPLLRHGVC